MIRCFNEYQTDFLVRLETLFNGQTLIHKNKKHLDLSMNKKMDTSEFLIERENHARGMWR